MEPRDRFVKRALLMADQAIERDVTASVKEQFRAPHIMGAQEVDDMLERKAEAIYQSAGVKRVANFN